MKSSILGLPKFADELPAQGGIGGPLVYALLPTMVSAVLGAALMTAAVGVMVDVFEPTASKPPATVIGMFVFMFYSALAVVSYLAYLAMWPAVLVGIARMTGNRLLTYRGVFGILCYASGLNCLYFLPLVGLVAAVYHLVVASVSIAAFGRTSVLVGFAMYGVPVLLFGGCCGTSVLFTMLTLGSPR